MLPEDIELQVQHFRGSLSGPAYVLFESMAKKIKMLEAKVNCSRPQQLPNPGPFVAETVKSGALTANQIRKAEDNEPPKGKVVKK